MYKGVVFDLDGTLVDSPLCFQTIRKQLEIPPNHYILEYLETLPPGPKAEKHRQLEEIELAAARDATVFPGVLEVLSELRQRQVRLGIFTRNCRSVVELVAGATGMSFDLVITRDDAPAKPDPTGLRKFLTEWRLQGHELLFVGDFRFDIECGKRVGVKTALFTNGQDYDGTLMPDYFVSQYSMFIDQIWHRGLAALEKIAVWT